MVSKPLGSARTPSQTWWRAWSWATPAPAKPLKATIIRPSSRIQQRWQWWSKNSQIWRPKRWWRVSSIRWTSSMRWRPSNSRSDTSNTFNSRHNPWIWTRSGTQWALQPLLHRKLNSSKTQASRRSCKTRHRSHGWWTIWWCGGVAQCIHHLHNLSNKLRTSSEKFNRNNSRANNRKEKIRPSARLQEIWSTLYPNRKTRSTETANSLNSYSN